jgi:galactosamine-6-phosphate isomerase
MIQLQTLPDYESLSRHAADWIAQRVRQHPSAVVALAAGTTPHRTYEMLAERNNREPDIFAKCRFLQLDEWGGLPPGNPATCAHQLRSVLITPLKAADRYVAFDSDPADPIVECNRIADWLSAHGPIDLSILGLGLNGHIGFNEPAENLTPHCHVAQLAPTSLNHAMVRDSTIQPKYGMTLGMADLLQCKEILLLVSGAAKRNALWQLMRAQMTTSFPASFLHLHPRVTLLTDRPANSEA